MGEVWAKLAYRSVLFVLGLFFFFFLKNWKFESKYF